MKSGTVELGRRSQGWRAQKETDVVTPASVPPESNTGRGARASTDNLVRVSGSDGPWHTESEEATATRRSHEERFRGVVTRESETRLGHNGLEERERERANAAHSAVENNQGIAERDAMGRL